MEVAFAGSDFWICDLGLEFFHWPDQKILRGETMRTRFCKVLESTNPNPSTNGYSRVVSWIDNESLGIVQAKAYDAKGELLKDFYPKDVKKVDGQWQVGRLDIYNIQTGSHTRLEFDLNK
ncbi:MAG TPA: outer membrane lipoprotein-sorting protein [Verrucomicrobiae bacterium]|nr:outer membrane lipoprotein-sorting protein [Verrucomicrobiae bacterium]